MIIGHEKQRAILESFLRKEGMHHSFLFRGPESIGKYLVAEQFASHIATGEKTVTWKKTNIRDGDLMVIAPEKIKKKNAMITKDISIENIRSINKKLSLAAINNSKILIINDAHRLTRSAQNALLKTLEEPPKDVYIFLVTHMPEFLLDTITSRCFSIQFDLVEKHALESMYAQSQYIDDAQGRPGFLKKIHDDEDFRTIVIYAREQLQGLFKRKMHERIVLAQDLAKKDEYFITIFFTVWIYRIWYAAHSTQKYHLLHVADRVEDLLQKMQRTNVNKQLALEDLLINIV